MQYIEHYRDIKKVQPFKLRDHARKIALDGLSLTDRLRGIDDLFNKPRIQFLYIHHVFRDEEEKLIAMLDKLARNHTFISYGEAVSKLVNREIDRPYINVSSDDGLKNNLKLAEILSRFGTKGCFFVNPAIVGVTDYQKVEHFCKARLRFPPVEFLDWKDIDFLLKSGHEIGAHTMDHMNVAETPEELFVEDCQRTYEIFTVRCGKAEHFAFPYGRFFHFSETGRKTVFDTGYISCATAERGCHINHDKPLSREEVCIRRDHVILDWDLRHTLHFLAQNSRKASSVNNLFPY